MKSSEKSTKKEEKRIWKEINSWSKIQKVLLKFGSKETNKNFWLRKNKILEKLSGKSSTERKSLSSFSFIPFKTKKFPG